jgi:flagellar motor switch protein FliN/FliY
MAAAAPQQPDPRDQGTAQPSEAAAPPGAAPPAGEGARVAPLATATAAEPPRAAGDGARSSLPATPEGAATVQAMFPDLQAPDGPGADMALLLDLPLLVTVELGRSHCQVRDILALAPGAVLALDRLAGEPVDVLVNGRRIARGEVVVVDDSFGVRVTEFPAMDEGRSR